MVAEQPSIFVSYAHEDSQIAHELAHAMERHGARVWLDQGELLVGDSLIARISEAIAEFDFVAALVSRHSVASNWCQKEIALAMSEKLSRGARRVTVLPLRVADVEMPPSLRDVKWLPLDVERVDSCAAEVVGDAVRHLTRQPGHRANASGMAPRLPPRHVEVEGSFRPLRRARLRGRWDRRSTHRRSVGAPVGKVVARGPSLGTVGTARADLAGRMSPVAPSGAP